MSDIQKTALTKLLSHPTMVWRKLSTLANTIGATEADTTGLLLEIGARGSANGSGKWALIERVGLPGAPEPDQIA